MIGKLEFQLPEDQSEFDTAINANKFVCVLHEFDNDVMRRMTKYDRHPTEDRELTEQESELANLIRQELWRVINDNGIGELV